MGNGVSETHGFYRYPALDYAMVCNLYGSQYLIRVCQFTNSEGIKPLIYSVDK